MVLTRRPPAAPAPYAHTGQGHDRRQRGRRTPRTQAALWRLEVAVGSIALVAVTVTLTVWPPSTPTRPAPTGLRLVRSGLVMSDPLSSRVSTGALMDHYVFNGSAGPQLGRVTSSPQGLHVGVGQHPGWAGWFAVTLHSAGPAVVWHAVVSRPSVPVARGAGEAILAVQSASTQRNGSINYVIVAALSLHGRSTWQVGSAHGLIAGASTDVLWQEPLGADVAAREPVTITTDGRHTLAVWLGDQLVYASTKLTLDDPPPFQAYLEVQARDRGYVAAFKDFWVTDAAPVTVRGTVPGAHVRLDTAGGPVYAIADRAGRAALSVSPADLVGTGTLTVSARGVTHHYDALHYAGGDVWQLAG